MVRALCFDPAAFQCFDTRPIIHVALETFVFCKLHSGIEAGLRNTWGQFRKRTMYQRFEFLDAGPAPGRMLQCSAFAHPDSTPVPK